MAVSCGNGSLAFWPLPALHANSFGYNDGVAAMHHVASSMAEIMWLSGVMVVIFFWLRRISNQ